MLAIILMAGDCFAQEDTRQPAPAWAFTDTGQKDIIDVAKYILKIKPSENKLEKKKNNPLHTGKVAVAFLPFLGYAFQVDAFLSGSLNTSFTLGRKSITNLSVVSTSFQYLFHRQFEIPLVSNIWTSGNKYNLLGDYRYFRYPSNTYGLGAGTSKNVYDPISYSYVRLSQEILQEVYKSFYAGVGFHFDEHWSIKSYDSLTDFQQYNKYATHTTSSGILLHGVYDTRKNTNNPKNAMYASLSVRPSNKFFGSTDNWLSVLLEYRKYMTMKSHPSNVLAFWSYNVFTFGNAPYLDLPANGWDIYGNTGRGYSQGRFRGKEMIYMEMEDRFRLLRNGLLGGVFFVNAETVTEWPGTRFQRIAPAIGTGLRIKFNKKSDTNICIDFGVGLDGSYTISLNLGEVF